MMLVSAGLLAVGATNRNAGVAWGSLPDAGGPEEFVLPSSGFIVVDMSSVYLTDEGDEVDLETLQPSEFTLSAESPSGVLTSRSMGDVEEKIALLSVSEEESSWKFPDRVVLSAGSDGISGTSFSNAGISRLSGFRLQLPDHLSVEGDSIGNSVNYFAGTGSSRLSGFRITLPRVLPVKGSSLEFLTQLTALAGQSRLDSFKTPEPNPGDGKTEKVQTPPMQLVGKMATDYDSVVLSVAEDGKTLITEDDPESSNEEQEVVLTEVKPLWKEYVVKAGETMSTIAVANGVSIDNIVKANDLKNPNRLAEKQILLIPNNSDAVDATLEAVLMRKARIVAAQEKVSPVKVTAYIIAAGDSLWSVANSQNLEIDTLYGCNNLKNPDLLRPGVTLRIPDQDGVFYKVAKGDTLDKIAKSYGIPVDRIRKGNAPETTETLIAGNEIFLPGARPEASDNSSGGRGSSGSGKNSSAPAKSYTRSYRWPVVGKINSPFGWRRHPVTRRRDFHTGVDIKSPRGRAIKASKNGRVEYSGWMGGYGKVVVIRHGDGYSTLYAHCNSISVRKGQSVSQGQNIATVGTTGRTTGPHLHFEIRNGKSPVNPLRLLR
ncbi:MAG: LysM peptidoglycan-binding domain-containing M23 family metallopeptidase [Synergistaceae bacterium]|nr:LysM peptidoglycan-binding domain-containing M23 family metallopeptidase [Synergistaceae bacterium]